MVNDFNIFLVDLHNIKISFAKMKVWLGVAVPPTNMHVRLPKYVKIDNYVIIASCVMYKSNGDR